MTLQDAELIFRWIVQRYGDPLERTARTPLAPCHNRDDGRDNREGDKEFPTDAASQQKLSLKRDQ